MKIKWHGHACFEIVTSDGRVIVIDPHDGISIGLRRPHVLGDIILVTHNHFDHNAVDVVKKPESIVLKSFTGSKTINGINIKGVKAYHDRSKGRLRGSISIYVIEADGLKIVHLGDLGHILTDEHVKEIGEVDILFNPVGGTYTTEPDEAWKNVGLLKPRIVVPMHYWVPGLNLPLKPVEDFLRYAKKYRVVRLETNSFEVARETLPAEPSIYVLRL